MYIRKYEAACKFGLKPSFTEADRHMYLWKVKSETLYQTLQFFWHWVRVLTASKKRRAWCTTIIPQKLKWVSRKILVCLSSPKEDTDVSKKRKFFVQHLFDFKWKCNLLEKAETVSRHFVLSFLLQSTSELLRYLEIENYSAVYCPVLYFRIVRTIVIPRKRKQMCFTACSFLISRARLNYLKIH